MLLGYAIPFAKRTPEFDEPAKSTEVKLAFTGLLMWHLLLAVFKAQYLNKEEQFPAKTVLILT